MSTAATAAPTSSIVREVLGEYGTLAREHLERFVSAEGSASFASLMADYPTRGGRSLRSSLCLATARAFGGSLADALDTAVAVEIMHNAFLVHDDVEDDSEERRGRPTLHLLHGVPIAVNVGDALSVMSLAPLLGNTRRLGPRLSLRILEEAHRMARESVEGQALELHWRENNVVSLDESSYLALILKKTCWYTTIFPMRAGALIATRDRTDLDAYVSFGFFVGAAFQIQDDLLNLIGDPERYGKELNGDILEGKRTLMLIHLLSNAEAGDRARLVHFLGLGRRQRTEQDVRWVRRCMDRYGAIDYARQVANGLAGAALHEFSRCFDALPDSRDKDFLRALPFWAIERA